MNFFQSASPRVDENDALRAPQKAGYEAIRAYFENPADGTEVGIVLPVGTGKTALIALAPFAVRSRRTLVIAPGLRIADQLNRAFNPSVPDCVYKRYRIVDDFQGLEPVEMRGDDVNREDLDLSNVVITNIQQLQARGTDWLTALPRDFFDLIINDEAHHNVATSWTNVREAFPDAKIINFSATPDRADGKRMAGKIIYTYSVFQAIADGYVKSLTGVVLNPRTLKYVRRAGGQEVEVDLEEVKRLGQQDADFRRSIVSSSESLATIVDASIRELEHRRAATGNQRHKIIASALNMEHCIQVTQAYRARGMKCEYVHSKLNSKVNDRILRQLSNDELDVVVQVRMLGEGFDHPYFSVAAILSIFANLSPFVQFIGRIMRSLRMEPIHENNVGTVVFHAGANVASLWSDFQDFSKLDQDLFDQLLPTREVFVDADRDVIEVVPKPRPYEQVIEITTQRDVNLESIPLVANDPEAQDAIAMLLSKGITVEDFRKASELLTPVYVTAQKRRQAARSALDSRARTATARILAERGLSAEGHGLDAKHLGRSNYVVLKTAIDAECHRLVGKGPRERSKFTQKDFDEIDAAFPNILAAAAKKLFDDGG